MQAFRAEWESGRWVKFRPLTWAEFKAFDQQLRQEPPAAVYERLYRAVWLEGARVDDPDPIYAAPAGMMEWVAHALLDQNPFNCKYEDVKRALEMKRGELHSDWMQSAKAVVASLFHYSFEQIEKMDAERFFELIAAAEFVSGRKLEPGNPEKRRKNKKPTRPLTDAQSQVIERVQQRQSDPRMPMPAEEHVYDPQAPPLNYEENSAPRKKQLTPGQQMVADRVNQARRQR